MRRILFLSYKHRITLLCFFKLAKKKNNFSLRKIINGDAHVICYDNDGVLPQYLQNITQDYFSLLCYLYVPTEERDSNWMQIT